MEQISNPKTKVEHRKGNNMVRIEYDNCKWSVEAKGNFPWKLCAELIMVAEHAIRSANEINASHGFSKEELFDVTEEALMKMLEHLAKDGIIRAKTTE